METIRKEINFCHKMNLNIIGIVENMSTFVCPCCQVRVTATGRPGAIAPNYLITLHKLNHSYHKTKGASPQYVQLNGSLYSTTSS